MLVGSFITLIFARPQAGDKVLHSFVQTSTQGKN
jgi:hypothetical protein